jgi:ADP-ribose pyrophosphatase YjhB (NUDIX family)
MIKLLSKKKFLKTFDYAPRLAVSLIIENKRTEILLARRAIPPCRGFWHMPGSFVLKGESLNNCIKRIILKELGLKINTKSVKLVGVFDNLHKDPRGHVIDVIYKLKIKAMPRLTEETKEVKFFSTLPPHIGFNHRETLRVLGY